MRESMRDDNGNTITQTIETPKNSKGVLHKMGKIANPSQWSSRNRKPPGSFSQELKNTAVPTTSPDILLPPIPTESDLRNSGLDSMNGAIVLRRAQVPIVHRTPQGGSGNISPVPRKSISGPEQNPYSRPTNAKVRSATNSNGQGPHFPVPLRGGNQHAMTGSNLSQKWEPGPDPPPVVDVNGGLYLNASREVMGGINEVDGPGHVNGTYINLKIANGVQKSAFTGEPNMTGAYSRGEGPPRRNNTWEEPSTRMTGAITRNTTTVPAIGPVPHNLQAENDSLREALRRAQEDKGEANKIAHKLTNSSLVGVQGSRQWEAVHRDLDLARQQLEHCEISLQTKSEQLQQSNVGLGEAQSNFNALQASMEALQNLHNQLKGEFESLKVDHDSAVADRMDLANAQEEFLQTIDRLRGDFGPHLDDEYFKDCHDKLRRDIERWSVDYFKGPISGLPSPSAALMEMSDDCDEYLQSQLMRPKLVQSYIWSVLNTKVFACNARTNPGFWWAHSRRNQFSGLVAFLQPSGKCFPL